jgi:hypothetical protein
MIPEARACSIPLHTTRPYLTNPTYRENAEALVQTLVRGPGAHWSGVGSP